MTHSSVSNSSKTFANNNVTVSCLLIALELKRQSFYYTVTMIYPTILLEVLMFFPFMMPHGSPLKVTVSASLVLTMYVLQKDSAQKIPSFSDENYPKVLIGMCAGMGLGAVTLVACALSVIMCQLEIPLPKWAVRCIRMPSSYQIALVKYQKTLELDDLPAGLADFNATGNTSIATLDCCGCHSALLVRLKLERAEERRRVKMEEYERKLLTQAWHRIDFLFNFLLGTAYICISTYYSLTCLLGLTD